MTGRKILTVPERRNQSHVSFIEGCKGAVYGLGIGVVASAISFRFSPAFRALARPYQLTMVGSGGFSGYLFGAEQAAFNYKNQTLGYVDHKTMDRRVQQNYKALGTKSDSKTLRFINENRWALLGATWASSMVSAYAYSFRVHKSLTFNQKIFHARIYAQFVTLAALMASAGLAYYVDENDKKALKDIPENKLRAVLELPMSELNKSQLI